MLSHATVGDSIPDEAALEELLSEPSDALIEAMPRITGDCVILGVGGKMGPTLVRMLRRASEAAGVARRIVGVSRFSQPETRQRLEIHGIETIACDLLDPAAVAALPDAPNVIVMAAQKFGTAEDAPSTWAANTVVPTLISHRYAGRRLVAFSTGNVYPLTPVASGGPREDDPVGPIGEYAWSALARERVYTYLSRRHRSPMVLVRLNYAVEMRYGVLLDLATAVWEERPIDLAMGHVNCIWQADANDYTLRMLEHAAVPPTVFNLTGPETLSVREIAQALAERMGRPVHFTGSEAPDALLNNATMLIERFGPPRISPHRVLDWTARWVMDRRPTLGRPTHFEVRSGTF